MSDILWDRYAEALALGRMANWIAGDIAALIIKEEGKAALGRLATEGHCHTEHVAQTIRVGRAFPADSGKRSPEIPWTYYLECYRAAKRAKPPRDPVELFEECRKPKGHEIENPMSVAEVKWLYRSPDDKPPVLRFAATCKVCGARTITHIGDMAKAQAHGLGEGGVLCIMCSVCGRYLGKVE